MMFSLTGINENKIDIERGANHIVEFIVESRQTIEVTFCNPETG